MPARTGGGTHPVNPLPAKRIPAQIRSLCRAYTDCCEMRLNGVCLSTFEQKSNPFHFNVLLLGPV